MRATVNNCHFIMIDVQEKFRPVIHEIERVIANCDRLCQAASLLSIPLTLTEQYPAGLGRTMSEILVPHDATRFEKMRFSIFEEPVRYHLRKVGRNLLVMFGIEAHICVTQSALDARNAGYDVMIVADAVSSRNVFNHQTALTRLAAAGCEIVTTEMLLFECLESANHPKFGKISKLVK